MANAVRRCYGVFCDLGDDYRCLHFLTNPENKMEINPGNISNVQFTTAAIRALQVLRLSFDSREIDSKTRLEKPDRCIYCREHRRI